MGSPIKSHSAVVAPAHVTPTHDALERQESPADHDQTLHYPSQHQGNLAASNLLQSVSVKDREISQRLTGSYVKGLNDTVRSLRKNLHGSKPSLQKVLTLLDGDTIKAFSTLKLAARQAKDEGCDKEHVVLVHLFRELRGLGLSKNRSSRQGIGPKAVRPSNRSGEGSRRRTSLKKMYSGTATGLKSVLGLIDTLLAEQEEPARFELKLQKMHNTISDDLAALAPTASQRQIRTIVHGINTLRHVAILLQSCKRVMVRMTQKNIGLKMAPVKFLQELLRLSSEGMKTDETLQLTKAIGGKHLKHQLAFLNALRPMLQNWPISLWRDKDNRRIGLDNLRTLMTQLTEQEQNQGAID